MPTVRVKWFNEIKGYGYISAADGVEVYVHYSDIERKWFRTLNEYEEVEFEIREGSRGKQAFKVRRLSRCLHESKLEKIHRK